MATFIRYSQEYELFVKHIKRSEFLQKCKDYAIKCHRGVNHYYDNGLPYETHLEMVYEYAIKYSYLLDHNMVYPFAACWTHDTIEDTRQSYNNVLKNTSQEVADITYALTNEKGKNRKERANAKYYNGIKRIPYAVYVKICDRLANVSFSKSSKHGMWQQYKKENKDFEKQLYDPRYEDMFAELRSLLS